MIAAEGLLHYGYVPIEGRLDGDNLALEFVPILDFAQQLVTADLSLPEAFDNTGPEGWFVEGGSAPAGLSFLGPGHAEISMEKKQKLTPATGLRISRRRPDPPPRHGPGTVGPRRPSATPATTPRG